MELSFLAGASNPCAHKPGVTYDLQVSAIIEIDNITTDHIQQYLDENKSLILKIVESQNSGKLTECAENQSRLQRNLTYLAAIADPRPQPPTMPGGRNPVFNDNFRLNVCNVDSSLKWFVRLSIAYTGATPDVMAMSAMPGKEVTRAAAASKSPGDEPVSRNQGGTKSGCQR
ncbi:hypothetical protein KIW84_022608 [Lathyrus oleraceus]|uniref:SS18 N-terminal domain-containing protein n=1 Tax=Pisum sativum TaxID=3888 RepID=A0A9D5B5I3_PEA|nr:hypothetical protein KIW84_022608 [Pisum sativum]